MGKSRTTVASVISWQSFREQLPWRHYELINKRNFILRQRFLLFSLLSTVYSILTYTSTKQHLSGVLENNLYTPSLDGQVTPR